MAFVEDAAGSTWRSWAKRAAVWSAPALFSALETYSFSRDMPQAPAPWRVLAAQMPAWYVWLPLTPWLTRLALRERLNPLRVRPVLVHLLACLGMGALFAGVYATTTAGFMPPMPGRESVTWAARWLRAWWGWLPMMGMAYATVLAVASANQSALRARDSERQAAALAVQLAESRLLALQSQLHPHFLFNTLNAIVVLVRERETQEAARMLVLLSDLLRQLLQKGATQEVPLRDEVAVLSRYLELQRLRFADRLRVEWAVDPDVLEASVPHLVLQPLAENALRHGIGMRSAAGVLRIGARRLGDALELTVGDDGPGLPREFDLEACQGIGLSNTRARLSQLYGDAGHLRIRGPEGVGTVATVLLPWRCSPDSAGVAHG
ncbi:sensor histidine kinase [Corallococcus sp. Z5C101001]|uniref:sensor histidine kinase n=1 Tax=Corallococcus sp. Z5C101001 TaxID=2596829 RepID=UPI00117FADC2|nr:histidine kinase [Corallococcus sp. Z5C101001]TSC22897.1 sensor histidine kinase [Corallococcus sp. Z5C101001]